MPSGHRDEGAPRPLFAELLRVFHAGPGLLYGMFF